jgi:hypothetical protein
VEEFRASVAADDLYFRALGCVAASPPNLATRLLDRSRLGLGLDPQVVVVPLSISRRRATPRPVDAAPKQLDDHVGRQYASIREAVVMNRQRPYPVRAPYPGYRRKIGGLGNFVRGGA